jgi:tRNA uridine 5-carboxymethylaminomethyl modification enzyme
LLAGINAALWSKGESPVVLKRDQAYLGVMIDDLTTQDLEEPYRLFTSRAEHRLLLRHDNADLRLSRLGHSVGLLGGEQLAQVEARRAAVTAALAALADMRVHPRANGKLVAAGYPAIESAQSAVEYLRRPDVSVAALATAGLDPLDSDIADRVEIEVKYAGYIARQDAEGRRRRALEEHLLPAQLDYLGMTGLRTEARERLDRFRPSTVGQASRISGVTPADIAVLLFRIRGRS